MSATRGNWSEVWDSGGCRGAIFADRRQKAKASNDVADEAEDGEDMFARAGVAAE